MTDSTSMTDLLMIRDLLLRICETPAPTFAEEKRAALIQALLTELELDARIDAIGNVIAALPGGSGPRVLIAAHLDTVFSADTDVTVKVQGGKLLAPGVGDNSASLAVLMHYCCVVRDNPSLARPRITVAATVGEEGEGDIRGIRALLNDHPDAFDYMIALDGHLGTIVDKSVGSKRYDVQLFAKGGHSWGDYPSPSAVHALAQTVYNLTRIKIPREPRSSLNIGQISGGTSVNAIAEHARFNLDLRSVDNTVLLNLEAEALKRIKRVALEHDVRCEIQQIGDRPTARVNNLSLVKAAREALASVNESARTAASSTDANAAMALNIPAISFGVYHGGDAHRLSEWLEFASLQTGYDAFTELMRLLAHFEQ